MPVSSLRHGCRRPRTQGRHSHTDWTGRTRCFTGVVFRGPRPARRSSRAAARGRWTGPSPEKTELHGQLPLLGDSWGLNERLLNSREKDGVQTAGGTQACKPLPVTRRDLSSRGQATYTHPARSRGRRFSLHRRAGPGAGGEMESSSRAVSTHTDRLPNAGEPPPDAFRILTTLSNIYTSRFQGVHPHSEKCKVVCFAYAFGYFPTAGCKHFILILNCSPSASAHVSDGVLLFRVEVVLLPNQSPFESQSAERVTSSLRGDTTAKGMNATPAGDKDVAPTPTPPEQRHTEQRELPAVRPAAPAAQRSHRTRGQHQ